MTATIEAIEERAAPPACLSENPHRLVSLWDVYQLHAHNLFKLFDELRDFEIELGKSHPRAQTDEEQATASQKFLTHLAAIQITAETLQLSSSQKQVKRIKEALFGKIVPGDQISPLLKELRVRIREDLEAHVYLCVPEKEVSSFWIHLDGSYQVKVPSELMDSVIVERFPSASDDIDGVFRCFVLDCFAASMFHLMRVVEAGVMELAVVSGLKDPKPSWGAVLQHVEKLVLRTKLEDIDAAVRPHRRMMEKLLPQMQAIQRAWRNKFNHVGTAIIPNEAITGPVATEIITAVEAFMRQLSSDLPPLVP